MEKKRFATTSVLTVLALAALILLSPASAVAKDVEIAIDPSMLRGEVTERASGEIRVAVPATFLGADDEPYRVSLSFPNRDTYEAALKQPFEALKIHELETILLRKSTGEVRELRSDETKLQLSTQQYLDKAESALCGDIVLRARTELPSGILMGINVHAAPSRIQPHQVQLDKNTLPGDCVFDVFDDCDFFAFGGCGGPSCVNICEFGNIVFTFIASCIELDLVGPNTCFCS